jgi:hypothetical protein
LKIPPQKRTGGVAQDEGHEFKLQYKKKKKTWERGAMMNSCKPSTQEIETRRITSLKSA